MLSELIATAVEKVETASSRDVLWSLFAFTALTMSWAGYLVSTVSSRRHETRMRRQRRENRSLEVVFFDITANEDGSVATLRSQPLESVRLDDSWDIAQRSLIEQWDSRDGSAIVCPKNSVDAEALADRVYTLASCTLSSVIPAIRGYLGDDQIADERDGFKHVRFLACLARPHASTLTWRDVPRLIVVPVGTARKIVSLTDQQIGCKHSSQNRKAWLGLIRDLGIAYRDRDRELSTRAITSLDIGFEH